MAYVQAGRLLSAKPNKQNPLELSTLRARPDASSLATSGPAPCLGRALPPGLHRGFGVTTTLWGAFPFTLHLSSHCLELEGGSRAGRPVSPGWAGMSYVWSVSSNDHGQGKEKGNYIL